MEDKSAKIHGGNIYAAARDRGGCVNDYLDFSANINPLGLSNRVRSALHEAMELVVCYPDPDATALKTAIAETYQVPAECIETGNGAVELIYLLCRVLSPERVLLPEPTFGEYPAAARAAGLPVASFPLQEADQFQPDLELLTQALRPGDLLFFCNPNNPTGTIQTRWQLEPLIRRASTIGAHVAVDESFIDFRPPDREESCRSLVGEYAGLTVLHSLTKFLAVPGLRLGFMLGRPDLVRQMKFLRDPWNVNVMAQAAGVAGLSDGEYRRETVALVGREKEKLWAGLQQIVGIEPLPPAVNFVLARLSSTGWDAVRLQETLWQEQVLIRNCASFSGLSASYMRVAVKKPEENLRLLALLERILCGEDVK